MVVEQDRERLRGRGRPRRSASDGGFDCSVTDPPRDGELRDVRIRGAVHRAGGGPRHLIGICQDLTDIRAAERARIELDERFRSVFERAPVGIALVAPRRALRRSSTRRWRSSSAATRDELAGHAGR